MKQTNHKIPRRLRRLGMLAIALILAFSLSTQVRAQVTGTKTVAASGGDYTSLAAAITALNTNGVGAGGAIINVPANWTETAPAGGYSLGSATLNASLSSTATLIIQKSGAGSNPLLTAQAGTITETYFLGLGDGIFDLKGVDYVTIDGIDLTDPTNATTATRMQHGYGLFKLNSTVPLNGCQNNTIKNCTITLSANTATGTPTTVGIYMDNRVSGTAGSLAVNASASDANSYNRFYANTIQKVGVGIFARGFYNATSLANFDTNNDFGGNSLATGNTIRSYASGQSAGISGGIIVFNQVGANISYNTLNNLNAGALGTTGPTGGTMHHIYSANSTTLPSTTFPTTTTAARTLSSGGTFVYNTITSTTGNGAGSSVPVNCIYVYYLGGSFNISNNSITFASNNGAAANTSTMYGIYNYFTGDGGAGSFNYVKNNSITGTFAHSSTFYGIYNFGYNMVTNEFSGNTCINLTRNLSTSGTAYLFTNYSTTSYLLAGGTCNIFNNVISTITMNNTTGTLYGWYYMSGGNTTNIYNNSVSNMINAGTGSVYGMYPYYYFGAGGTNFYGNTVDNITANTGTGTAGGGIIYGIRNYIYYGSGSNNFYSNTVSNLKCGGNSGTIYGWYNDNTDAPTTIRNNKIIGLQNNSTLAGASNIYGIYDATFNGFTGAAAVVNYQNNLVHTGNYNVMGDSTKSSGGNHSIYITSGSTRTVNFYYNTIFTTGKSTQPAYGAHSVFNNTSIAKMLLMNNIFYNEALNASAVPTSKCTSIRLTSTLANTYDATSNKNSFYLASPNALDRFYYFDGTTGYSTMAATQTAVSPREGSSFVENVAFQSTTPSNANLFKINLTSPTQLEGNAAPIAGITSDYAGTVRQGNVGYAGTSTVGPDIGAYEGEYTGLDLLAPGMTHTALSLTCNTTDRSFTATITDATGVDITTNVPYVYFKKNSGSWNSAAGTLVSGNTASSVWSFTISAAAMGGLVATDVVSYFIAAQDIAGTPNIGSLPAGAVLTNTATLTTAPTTPYSYTIGNQLSGTYQVGAGKAATGGFNTLTAAAAAYNTYCLSGSVVFELTDTLYDATTETFPVTFGANAYASATDFLTIRPAAGNNVNFRGTPTAFIKLNGADYITIDGSNNGTTSRNLNFYPTSTTASAAVWIASLGGAGNGATYNTIKNTNVVGNAAQGSTTTKYAFKISSTGSLASNGEANHNNTIQNNNIKKVWVGISALSASAALASNGLNFSNNVIGAQSSPYTATTLAASAPVNAVTNFGMEIENASTFAIVRNDIDGVFSTGSNYYPTGIRVGANASGRIDANKIHGMYMSTGGWGAYGIHINGTATGVLIKNNFIYDIMTENYNATSNIYNAFGIRISSATTSTRILNNTINLFDTVTLNFTAGLSACVCITSASQTGLDIRNNLFVNDQRTSLAGQWTNLIYYFAYAGGVPAGATINYNNYYGTTNSGIGANSNFNIAAFTTTAATKYATLVAWKAFSSQDANSYDVAPTFVSNYDLHLNMGTTPTLLESNGANLAADLVDDIDGDSRPGPVGSVNGGATAYDLGADEFDGKPLPLCTTPVAGTTNIASTLICPNQAFTVSLTGNTNPALVAGITFQWMVSTNGGTTWNTIAGATNPSYTSPGVAVPVMMHCVVSCSYSGAADSSSNVSLTFNNYYNCYCNVTHTANTSSTTAYGNITIVNFAGINDTSTVTMTAPFFTVVPNTKSGTLIAGQSYNLDVKLNYGYSSVTAWIDWNANGTFEASEFYNLGANGNTTTLFSTTITAPTTISNAISKIRIRGGYYFYPCGATDACTNGGSSSTNSFYYGESMDYFLTLVGIPATPANPVEGATPVSCNLGTTLSPVGSPAAGIVWYWQTSATGTSTASADSVSGPINIYGNGTYYIRAYNPTYNLWSTGAGSLVVTDFPAGPTAPVNPVAAANPACVTGTTVSSTAAPAGETYYWQTTPTGTSTANNAVSPYSVTTTSTVYVRSQDATGCWSSGSGSLAVTILPSLNASTFSHTLASNCSVGGAGTITIAAPSAAPLLPWYSNDFNGAFTATSYADTFGTAIVSGGKMICNQAAASQAGGGIQIFNPLGLNANAFQIDFDLETTYGNGNADGISYSFGNDVVQIPSVATTGTNPENGSGTKLKLSFDAYANASNTTGIYLMYNCNVQNQTPTTSGVLGYVANTSWCGGSNGTPVSKHISISITAAGKITVMLGNTVIFNQVQLPNGYLAANKSTWSHVFVSRTGSVYQEHAIDNFVVQYNDINYYQYSNNGGSTWGSANSFNVPVGIYPMAITFNANNACSSQLGNDTIAAPVFTATATSDSVCTYYTAMPTLSFSPSFTADSIIWESSAMGASTWSSITSAKGATYVPTVTANTDYRAAMYCAGSVLYRTDSTPVWAITPTITSTSQSVTPCGIGTATINATASAGASVNWYTNSAGGVPVATGGTYTTAPLLSTTNFYTSASIGGSGSLTIPGDGNWNHFTATGSFQSTTITGAYMILTIITPVTLTSLDIYPSAAVGTPFTIEARTGSASGTTFRTFSATTTVSNSGTPSTAQTCNVSWVLPAGTYYIGFPTTNPSTWRSGLATHTFPWTLPGICSLNYYLTPSYQYYFYNLKIGTGCASTPQAVAATVLTAPSIAATVTSATDTVCAGGSSSLNVTSANANYTYSWTPGTLSGAAQTVTPTPTTTVQTLNDYIVDASDAGTGCSARDTVRVVVNPNPSAVSVSPNSPIMLVGTPQMLTATGGTNGFATTGTLGTGTGTSSSNNITPYTSNWEAIRTQYLIRASELNALGIYAGNLSTIAFNCTSPSTGSPYNPQLNFTMKMGTTALTALSGTAYVATTGFTTVLSPRTLGLPTSGWNTYTFSTPFYWNGTSNIIIDMCHENDPTGLGAFYSGNSTVTTSTMAYTCQYGQYTDDALACGQTTIGTASSGTVRPNMKFGYSSFNANPFYWSPAQSLYMNANASTAYNAGAASNIVYANPRLDSVYTVTALNLTTGCKTTAIDTVFVEQPPVNYNCANASTLTITAACNFTAGSSKWGWYNPAAIPTTPASPTTATCGNADDDVWYTFTRPAGMTNVTVKVVGSNNYDVAFEILTGACGGTQTVVSCVNSTTAISNSTELYQIVVPSGAPAATYYVRVYDARTGYGSGAFNICVSGIVPPPANNDPCGAGNFSSNLASWGGASSILAAYDGGSPIFMGQANNSTANPPTGVNLVYFSGSTAYANNLGANEPTPPCGNLGSSAKTVWFKFKAPTIGGVDVTLRSLFNGNPTNFSTIIAAYAASVDPCTGTPTYTNIGCATTGVLNLTAASTVLAPYVGQFIYVQLAGNGASSPVGSYMLSIQAVPQNIALSNPTTSSLTVTLPTAPGASNVSVQWRAVGSSGYSLANISPSIGTYTITGLTSGVNYQVWAKYYNNNQAFYTNFATLGTTIGCSASPVAPTIIPVPNRCSRDTVQWPAHPLASTAFPYRLYWKQTASSGGYSVFAVPTSAYNATTGKVNVLVTNLAVNTSYQFYYRVLCAGGAQIVSGITNYTQCNGPAKMDGTFHGSFEHNGRYFVDADFVDVTSFTDNTPADGNVHEVVLNEVNDMNAVLNGAGVKVASNGEENGAFELIPNPTSDNVFVEYNLANAGRVVVRVMNIQGKVVKEEVMENSDASGAVQIDLSDVQSGVYMVSVDAPGYKATKRLVVTK